MITKKKFFVSILGLIIFYSCSDSVQRPDARSDTLNEATSNTDTANPATHHSPIRLDTFPSMPDTIEGCSGYYAKDENGFNKKQYILLISSGDFALIKINGKDVYLEYNETASSEELPGNKFRQVYKGHGYTATLIVKTIKEVDETVLQSGTLELVSPDQKTIINIYGESGC